MGPIMSIVNDIITIGGYESPFYSDSKLKEVFTKLKSRLQSEYKLVFDS